MVEENKKAEKEGKDPVHSKEDAADAINAFITGVEQLKDVDYKLRSELMMYLTLDQQKHILKSCAMLSSMGHGCGEEMMKSVVNEHLTKSVDERNFVAVSDKVLRLMRQRYPEIGKLQTAASIDPARADKANEDTRDTMFVKLDEFVYLLHRMGVSPWERWADVPARNKYNMDEMGTDTTNHRNKVYTDMFSSLTGVFERTPEGDGKMNRHITLCVTTRADGKYCCSRC